MYLKKAGQYRANQLNTEKFPNFSKMKKIQEAQGGPATYMTEPLKFT